MPALPEALGRRGHHLAHEVVLRGSGAPGDGEAGVEGPFTGT